MQGRDLGAVANDVERALDGVEFPLEYHAEVLGEYAERQAAQQRILLAGIIALIGIFLLLQASLESWRMALVLFLTLPVALSGGALAALAVGGVISLGSLVGLLTVLTIAVRNGVMLISHYQHLEQHEGLAFGPALVMSGSHERVTPILMTALTTALAFAPFAIAGSIPGNEIIHPITSVVLGGLVTTTALNLFIMPALYLRFGYSPRPVTSPVGELAVT